MVATIAILIALLCAPALARRINTGRLSDVIQIASPEFVPPGGQVIEVPEGSSTTQDMSILMPPKPSDEVLDQPETD